MDPTKTTYKLYKYRTKFNKCEDTKKREIYATKIKRYSGGGESDAKMTSNKLLQAAKATNDKLQQATNLATNVLGKTDEVLRSANPHLKEAQSAANVAAMSKNPYAIVAKKGIDTAVQVTEIAPGVIEGMRNKVTSTSATVSAMLGKMVPSTTDAADKQ